MRTTSSIDHRLLAEARAVAAATGRTLGAVVDDALREAFAGRATGPGRATATGRSAPALPVCRGSRLLPGVDLDHDAVLLEQMERAER